MKTPNTTGFAIATLCCCFVFSNATADRTSGDSPRGSTIFYVDIDSPGGDGSSWESAEPNLQQALQQGMQGEIWVAEGEYSTDPSGKHPDFSFVFENTEVYGGFQGDETARNQRDPATHTTTLTGGGFAFHVVIAKGFTTIDGFTITGGNANGTSGDSFQGGGVYNNGTTHIENCIITGNYATKEGGGLCNDSFTVTITDCVFRDNEAGSMGGAIYTADGVAEIFNSSFVNNGAPGGGAIFTKSHGAIGDISFVNRCVFTKNYITVNDGPEHITGGAAIKIHPDTAAVITNSLFTDNFSNINAIHGGIISAYAAGTGGDFVKIINCTIAYNTNLRMAPAVNGSGQGTLLLRNSIIWQNSGYNGTTFEHQLDGESLEYAEYSIIENLRVEYLPEGATLTNVDPLFRSARGADGIFRTGDENFTILPYSFAIDRADPTALDPYYPANQSDLDGNPRFVDDPYTIGTTSTLDVGCYEYTPQSIGTNGFRTWSYHDDGTIDFSTDSAWEPAVAPSANDVALINAPCGFTPTVTFAVDTSIQTLLMPQGYQTYNLQGNTLTCYASEPVRIGHYFVNDFALLHIKNGTIQAYSLDVAGINNASFAAVFLRDNATLKLDKGCILRKKSLLAGGGTIDGVLFNSGKVEFDSEHYTYPTVTGDYFMTHNSTEGLFGTGGLSYMLYPIDGTPSLGYDEMSVGGVATLAGGLQIQASWSFPPQVGDTRIILEASGGITGNFESIWSTGFGADKVPIVSIATHEDGIGQSVVVVIQSVSELLGFGPPDGTGLTAVPADAKIGDIDGDGNGDLVLSLPNENSVLVLYNSGSSSGEWGGFNGGSQQITVGTNPAGLTVGDFDNDNDIDIAVANTDDDTVTVLENTSSVRGTTAFTAYTHDTDTYADNQAALEAKPTDVTHGRFSASGYIDLAIANNGDGKMVIITGPLFTTAVMPGGSSHDTGGGAKDIDPGDVNNDKDFIALVVTGDNGESSVFRGSGFAATEYGEPTLLDMGESLSEQLIADLDGNGKPDIIVANPLDDSITLALQATDGSYSSPVTISLTLDSEPSSITALDIDGDSDVDLAIVMTNTSGVLVTKIFRNDTSSNGVLVFTDIDLEEGANLMPVRALSSDIDNDGNSDLIMITQANDNFTDEFFGYTQTVVNDHETTIPCPADFDGNGNVAVADLLVLIAAWGPGNGPEDLNGNGTVNVADLLLLIGAWGACP